MTKTIVAVLFATMTALSAGTMGSHASAHGTLSASAATIPPGDCNREAPKSTVAQHPAGGAKSALVRSWSAPIGWQDFISNGVIVSLIASHDNACIRGFSARTGRALWSYAHPSHPAVNGVTVTRGVVVASLVQLVQTAAGWRAVEGQLVALRLTTGKPMWHLALARQKGLAALQLGMPAVVHGNLVVVGDANGTVRAYGLERGRHKWTRPAPSGCPAPGGFVSSGLGDQSTPTLIGGNPGIVVARNCGNYSHTLIQGINPRNGDAMWTWKSPKGWSTNQGVTTEITGGDGAVAVAVRPLGSEHPVRWQAIHPSYISGFHLAVHGHGKTAMVVLDARTGRPQWQLRDVGEAPIVLGGRGTICVDTSVAIECRDATTGRWEWRLNTSWAPRDYSPSDESLPFVSDGMLWTAQPIGPLWSVDGFDLSSGRLAVRRYLTSARMTHRLPPSVTAVGRSVVLVSPQIGETSTLIAFKLQD